MRAGNKVVPQSTIWRLEASAVPRVSHVMSKKAFNIFAVLVGVVLPIALLIVAFML